MPIDELKEAGFSDQEIADYYTPRLQAAGFSPKEISEWLGTAAPQPALSSADWIHQRWKIGKAQQRIGALRYNQLAGDTSPELETEIQSFKATLPKFRDETGRSLPVRAVGAAAEMLPIQVEGIKEGLKRGLKFGTGAAAITVAAGQMGPQAATPEEIITVPAAAGGMFSVGFTSGTLENIRQIEAGLAYDELLDLRDQRGRPIDPRIAKAAAQSVGIINSVIEMAQLRLLLNTIPGGRRLLSGIVRDVTRKAVTSRALHNVVLRNAARYGKFVTGETLQEVAQESTNILANEIAISLNTHLLAIETVPKEVREEIIGRFLVEAEDRALEIPVGP